MKYCDGTGVITKYTQSFSHFINAYYKTFKEYILCHFRKIWQHKQRKHDFENVGEHDLVLDVDYINGPKVLYHSKSTGMWGGQHSFGFAMFHEGFQDFPDRQMMLDLFGKYDVDDTKQLEAVQETSSYYTKDKNMTFPRRWRLCADIFIVGRSISMTF